MDPIILDFTDFKPQFETISKELRIKPGSSTARELQDLIADAEKIARPKAIYTIASIEKQQGNLIHLNGTQFQSRILCINLDGVHRAFPYIATCGTELNQWKDSITDTIAHFFADHITGLALSKAVDNLYHHIKQQYGLGKTATMNPGSLEDWPLQAQTSLFSLFGDPQKAIGVYLTESLLMVPRQSVSGLIFETETDFVNCQLCPRKDCPNRRAPFNKEQSKKFLSE